MDLRVLDGSNPRDIYTWEGLVDRAPVPDVYYRAAYARANAAAEQASPVAILVRTGLTEALFPLLIREFEVDGQLFRDAITPYGYGGLLLVSGAAAPEPQVARKIFDELRDWVRSSKLLACTLRFHPLLDQESSWSVSLLSDERTKVFSRGQTTAVDLERWDDSHDRISGMNENRRRDLKAAKAAFELRFSGEDLGDDLKLFREVYRQTMERLHADAFFLFPDKYYVHLVEELRHRPMVVTALAEGQPVASAIFLADKRFAHYHLGGSNDKGRARGASTLVMVAGCRWARKKSCSSLHLGGGLRTEDSLWVFKRSFGGRIYSYKYMTLITDVERYSVLCSKPSSPWPYTSLLERVERVEDDRSWHLKPN
jgi:hypothetical protein